MKKLLIYCCFFIWFSCGPKEETIFPTQTRLTESVYSSVTIQPDSLYQAHAAVNGIVERNLVEEGNMVSHGTALVQIINNAPQLNTENARFALQLAQENYSGSAAILNSLQDEISSAELSLKNDSINFFRQKNLWEQNIGSRAQFENKKLAYELSQNKLRLLKNNYERTKNELFTNLQQARNNYQTSQIFTKDYTVTSKINGKVYAVYKNPGEIVNTMEPLASIGSAENFIIELLVDEVDIVKINLGQKTLVTLDAYGKEVFEAKVSKIYPKKNERTQTFKVEAIFTHPPNQLYPGLAGEGNIIIAEKEKVITIPRDYIINEDQVQTNDGLKTVILGLRNLERVEIIEGIDEKTRIIKP
jgi:HlyD family secretion protein